MPKKLISLSFHKLILFFIFIGSSTTTAMDAPAKNQSSNEQPRAKKQKLNVQQPQAKNIASLVSMCASVAVQKIDINKLLKSNLSEAASYALGATLLGQYPELDELKTSIYSLMPISSHALNGHIGSVTSVAVSPNGKQLVSGS